MKTLITEFISLDGVVQAPGGASEDTDGGFSHGGWSMKYFEPAVMGGTYAELAKHSDAQQHRFFPVAAHGLHADRQPALVAAGGDADGRPICWGKHNASTP